MTNHIGEYITCAETGERFVGATDGFTTNYATDRHGQIFSDKGVAIREERELLDRSKPFYCYISSDGMNATGWKGNKLGLVTWAKPMRGRSLSGQLFSYN